MITCDRCGTMTNIYIMSIFNEDEICNVCREKERKHPNFSMAVAAERAAVNKGNYNFPGIGKPDDL